MNTLKTILAVFLAGMSSVTAANMDTVWSLGAGVNVSPNKPQSPFIISEWVQDYFHQSTHPVMPSVMADVKKILPLQNNSWLSSIRIGPALYYDAVKSTGDVWELNLSQFDNYTYRLSVNQISLFAEADAYFKPLGQSLTPFVAVGLGASAYSLNYDDWVKDAVIPVDSELHLNSHKTLNFAYALGAGLAYEVNKQTGIFIKYRFQDAGMLRSTTAVNLISPIQIDAISHQIFLGVQYRA